MTVPTRPAASAPASTAAFTAATSPLTNAVTIPLPALSQPTISTLADLSIASVPSIRHTRPLHSSRPRASLGMGILFVGDLSGLLLRQFHPRRRFQVARVSFIRIYMHFENHLRVISHTQAVEGDAAGAVDFEFQGVAVFDAVVGH